MKLPVLSILLVLPLIGHVAADNTPSSGAAMKTPEMYFGDTDRTGLPFAKDPSVIRFGDRYLMYYSIAAFTKYRAPANAPKGWAIGIAESRDLVNWKKIGEILPEQDCEKTASSTAGLSNSMANFTSSTTPMGTAPKTPSAMPRARMASTSHATPPTRFGAPPAIGTTAARSMWMSSSWETN